MRIFIANAVHFDIKTVCWKKFFVDIVPVIANAIDVLVVVTAYVLQLAEELFAASTIRSWIINPNIMVFGIHWFLKEWLSKLLSFYH
jgi:hypothetical protein